MILPRMQSAQGFKVIIAGAGGAAHLPGMTAALTTLPVLGVPMETQAFGGNDSLLSIVQMPGGVPVGTLAVGKAGRSTRRCWPARSWRSAMRRSRKGSPAGWRSRRPRWPLGPMMRPELPLPPRSVIGILGGGQLGRMLALAAAHLA